MLHEPYIVDDALLWNESRQQCVASELAFLPPHEVLHAIIASGNESQFCEFSDTQQGHHRTMHQWGARLGVHMPELLLALAMWGDAAPSTQKDSLYLFCFTILNGACRQKFWITGFNKRHVCRCGCFGRHTFSIVWKVMAWSARALLSRRFPTHDHNNVLFPQNSYRGRLAASGVQFPWLAGFIAKFGDWAWFKQALDLTSWQGEGSEGRVC